MKIVVDSNIVFSALLSVDNTSKLLLASPDLTLYTSNFLFVELFKHKQKIQKVSGLTEDDLLFQLESVLKNISFIREDAIPPHIYRNALDLCMSVDEKDTPFAALSLYLDAPLLTGDKKLYCALKDKNFKVLSLKELLDE